MSYGNNRLPEPGAACQHFLGNRLSSEHWGVPSAWQGWAVVVAYFALLAGGSFFLLRLGAVVFAGYAICPVSPAGGGLLAQGRASALAVGIQVSLVSSDRARLLQ